MILGESQKDALLNEARRTIRKTLGARVESQSVPDDSQLRQLAGAFTTLHTLGGRMLRGCVGRLDCSLPLIQAVQQSAANALDDPRFAHFPVCLYELPELELEITVIFPMEPATDPMAFDLLNDGIYLTVGTQAGCFLPQVAQETGWNREQLLARLCTDKLGAASDAWKRPDAKLMKFKTLLVGPEPFMKPNVSVATRF
jgi:AmmeMemoRadiSam system protein A